MDCLPPFNRRTLEKKLAFSDEDFEACMVSLHLLFMVSVCSCGAGIALCTEMRKGRVKGNRYFRCKRRECRKKVGFPQRHLFEHSKLSLKDVFCLSAYWARHRNLTCEDIAAEMLRETGSKLGSHTLVDYMNDFWKVPRIRGANAASLPGFPT